MTFLFAFTDHALTQPITGLSMGHATLEGASGRVTSAGRTPNQSMMVFLAIVGLLDGIRDLLSGSRARDWEWVGVDSSFSVVFRYRGGRVEIVAMGEPIGEVTSDELARAVWEAASHFAGAHPLPRSDLAADDLASALEEFYDCLAGPLARSPASLEEDR